VDLRFSPEEQAFRQAVREFFATTKRPSGLRDYGATPTAGDIVAAKAWQRLLLDAGWAGLSWPKQHGGREASPMEQAIFAEEAARAGVPKQLNLVGLELAGPMLIAFGREEQKDAHLPRILTGDDVWCQLFSEPGAGSDLAGLTTRAEPDGDGWRVNGQKVWTSGAHYSDLGLLLARTDTAAAKHRGISCFVLPMDRPGIEIRPLRQIDGEAKFNEVFLSDVVLSEADLLGARGQGWEVALSTLGRERLTLGAQAVALFQTLESISQDAADRDDHLLRQELAACWSLVFLLRLTWMRGVGRGADPRALVVLKVFATELQKRIGALGVRAHGMASMAGEVSSPWADRLLIACGATLAGGTSEVQRNIIAERALGLPKE
jgi:alkylation response protein AidB-like acyl-CoA dehydrogenase